MPYQTTWVAAKKDPNRKCYAILPDGYEVASGLFACYQLASKDGTRCAIPENALHFCEKCGWVEGYPNQYKVNTLDSAHLSGQRGEDYHCARCGNHIGFSGVMS